MTKAGCAIPEGFFAFSKPQERERDLDGWRDWFQKKQINTVIVRDEKGRFILCRAGEEAK